MCQRGQSWRRRPRRESRAGVRSRAAQTSPSLEDVLAQVLVLGDRLEAVAHQGSVHDQARLRALGIGTRPFFWPMHEQPVLRRRGLFAGERYPVAERLARRGFYVPSGLALTDEQIAAVVAAVREVLS